MHPIIQKTFGGLSKAYFFRQLFFGLAMSALLIFVPISRADSSVPFFLILLAVLNALLYPYSRFVYESIVGFFMGDNVFFVNAIFMMCIKMFTMVLCWGFAIFIAPIGLLYLYFHHSKQEQEEQ